MVIFVNSSYILIRYWKFLLSVGNIHLENFLDFLWTSFIAFFGGKPSTTKIDSKQSYRSIIFISLLSGLIVFVFYKGYLSAELSVRIKKFPFTDLKSLSKTDWRYIFIFNKMYKYYIEQIKIRFLEVI